MTVKTDQPMSAADVQAERTRLGIPDDPNAQRSWIRYRLQLLTNPKTGRAYTQADIARECFITDAMVSRVYQGGHPIGRTSAKVRRLTAEILGVPEAVLFPSRPRRSNGTNGEGGI